MDRLLSVLKLIALIVICWLLYSMPRTAVVVQATDYSSQLTKIHDQLLNSNKPPRLSPETTAPKIMKGKDKKCLSKSQDCPRKATKKP